MLTLWQVEQNFESLIDRLQERLLVHLGLRLDQRVVDPLEDRVLAGGERVMLGLLDRVVGVAAGAVDVGDRVADRAGDPGLAGLGVHVVVVRVVELAREERDGVVAARAPAGGVGVAVALQRDLAGLADAGQVRLVVERAEVVRRVEPALVGVLVALQAVVVHHQRLGRDELAVGGDRRRREEVLLPLLAAPSRRTTAGPASGAAPSPPRTPRRPPAEPPRPVPPDPRPGQPVLDVEPDRQQRREHVEPVARPTAPPGRAPRTRRAGPAPGPRPAPPARRPAAPGRTAPPPCSAASTTSPGARGRTPGTARSARARAPGAGRPSACRSTSAASSPATRSGRSRWRGRPRWPRAARTRRG